MNILRKIVRFLVEKEIKEKDELLTEPDEVEGREEKESSGGGVAGATVPLGAGPNHPGPSRRRPGVRLPHEVAAAAFGGASTKNKSKK